MMKKLLLSAFAAAALLASAAVAQAQSGCQYIVYGATLTVAQWNSCFAAKNNTLGFTPVNKAGDTMLGKFTTIASATISSGFNLPHGVAPTSPVNGDLWTTTSGLFGRINGTTSQFLTSGGVITSPVTVNLNAASLQAAQTGTLFQGQQADGVVARSELDSFGAISSFTGVIAGGTKASPTAVTSGTQLTGINAFAYNGSAFVGPIVSFRTYAAENIASGHQGSKACFATTAVAGTTLTDHLCQNASGGVTVGSPTGSDEGADTFNSAGNIFQNGVQVDTISGVATLTNKTLTSPTLNSPIMTTPTLGVASGTSLALGGATIGSNALAVTGTTNFAGTTVSATGAISVASGQTVTTPFASITTQLQLGATNPIFWTGRGIISSPAAGGVQFGAADAAAPVAQTIGVQNVVAGTSNTAGVTTIFRNSAGTGTGLGGNTIFQYAPHGSTGSTQNAFATALTIDGDTARATFAGNIVEGSSATNAFLGALCVGNTSCASSTTYLSRSNGIAIASWGAGGIGWAPSTDPSAAPDTVFYRDSVLGAGNVSLGNGTANDKTGILNLAKVSAATGSGSAPSYTFAASASTGMSYAGSSNLVFALGGSATALVMDSSSGNPYITGNTGGQFVNFFSNGDLGLTPHAANKLYMGIGTELFGAADVAAPVAQTIGVQSVVTGTSNTAGVTTTFRNSAGTGTGVGGNWVFQYSPHGTTGSTPNAWATALTINGDTAAATFVGAVTAPAATFTGTVTTAVTGSTQCLQVNSSGVVSGSGVLCGGTATVLPNYITGCTLSTAGSSATFAIAPCTASDSTNAASMSVATAYTKTTSAWSLGTAGGSLDVGTTGNSLWYSAYEIQRVDTSVVDYLTSLAPGTSSTVTMTIASPGVITWSKNGLQANAPVKFTTTGALPTGLVAGTQYYVKTVVDVDTFTVSATQGGAAINTTGSQSGVHTATSYPVMPTNYTLFRRIGSMLTNGSAQWSSFKQTNGGLFTYASENISNLNVNCVAANTAYTVTAPPGVSVEPVFSIRIDYTGAVTNFSIGSGGENATWSIAPALSSGEVVVPISSGLFTNAARQIAINAASTNCQFTTFDIGYRDARGQ